MGFHFSLSFKTDIVGGRLESESKREREREEVASEINSTCPEPKANGGKIIKRVMLPNCSHGLNFLNAIVPPVEPFMK